MKKFIFKRFAAVLSALTMIALMSVNVSAVGEDDNLALGAIPLIYGATSSGSESYLNDGNVGSGAWGNPGAGVCFGVDFGIEKDINSVVTYVASNKNGDVEGVSRITKAKLQYSTNGTEWKDIPGTDVQLNTSTAEFNATANKRLYKSVFTFDTVNARYIRIYSIEAGNPQVFEFEAYYITNPNLTATAANVGAFTGDDGSVATAFKIDVTNSGTASGSFKSMDIDVTSNEETQSFENKTFTNMTLGVGASVTYGLIVNGLNDDAAKADVTLNME